MKMLVSNGYTLLIGNSFRYVSSFSHEYILCQPIPFSNLYFARTIAPHHFLLHSVIFWEVLKCMKYITAPTAANMCGIMNGWYEYVYQSTLMIIMWPLLLNVQHANLGLAV